MQSKIVKYFTILQRKQHLGGQMFGQASSKNQGNHY